MRAALVPALALLLGCNAISPKPDVAPVDRAAAAAFGRGFTPALEGCDRAKLDALFDGEQFGRISMDGAEGPIMARRGFIKEAAKTGLGLRLCPVGAQDLRYKFLRVHERDKQPLLLYRSLTGSGVNYVEFRLGRPEGGKDVRAVDWYSYLAGERFSETLRGMFEAQLAATEKSDEVMKNIELMKELRAAIETGKRAEARAVIARIPAALRKNKHVMLMDVMANLDAEGTGYQDAMARYSAAFPGDPSLDLVSIDGHFLKGDHAASLASIDRLDQQIGGDPYLDTLRASILLVKGDLDAAMTRAQAAVDREPTEVAMWWTLLTVILTRGDHAKAIGVMDQMKERFDLEFSVEAMAGQDIYKGLLASPEWTRRQAPEPPGDED